MKLSSRERAGRYLVEIGGSIHSEEGRALIQWAEECGYEGKLASFRALVYCMEVDGEVTRRVFGAGSTDVALTEAGFNRYRTLMPAAEVGPNLDDSRAEDLAEPEVVEAELVDLAINEPGGGIDYKQLVAAVQDLLSKPAPSSWEQERRRLESDLCEVKANLAKAIEEGRVQRQHARTWEETATRLERDKSELQRRLRRQPAPVVTEMRQLVEAAERTEGWRVERRTDDHWQLIPPTGQMVVVPMKAHELHAVRNARAELRRAGLPV